jgi:PBP1b-binding outer membrane lipoprotein LpoB
MLKIIRQTLCVVLCYAVFFAGCAGREPKPVAIYKPGDENRSCESLKREVVQLQTKMLALLPKTDKFKTNALWATAGVFLIVPYFMMDLKDAEKIEFEAMRQRHNRLLGYLETKNCDVKDIIAKPIPGLEQQKEEAEKILKQQQADNEKTQEQTSHQEPNI